MKVKFNHKFSNLSLIESDRNSVKDEINRIKDLDKKVQGMLLWSTVFALWSYLILIFRIFKIYASFRGSHSGLLTVVLLLIYGLFGGIIFAVWQGIKYKGTVFNKVSKTYLNYQIAKLQGQRRLISIYLLAYAVLLLGSCIFFFYDVRNGLPALFSATIPIGLLAYCLGLYFIVKFSAQKRKLDDLERKVSHVYIMDKITQN